MGDNHSRAAKPGAPRRPGRPYAAAGPAPDPRQDILVAASNLFSEKGVSATSMKEIAHALGLRGPSLYHYYGSKEAIFEEIVRYGVEHSHGVALDIRSSGGSAAERLHALLSGHVERLCSSPFNLACIVRDVEIRRPRYAAWKVKMDEWGEAVRGLIREGIGSGEFQPIDVGMAYITIAGVITGILSPVELTIQPPPREAGEIVASFIIHGLRGEAGKSAGPATKVR